MGWVGSAWVVGIITGILSGGLITLISRFILGRRENREYQQRILSANRDIIYAIRPGISEGQIPSREVVIAVIHSTARRHETTPSDIYDPTELAEELIKEVMDSNFLSSAKKSEYCTQLIPLLTLPEPELRAVNEAMFLRVSKDRQKRVEMMSILIGLSSSMVALFLTVGHLRRDASQLLTTIGAPMALGVSLLAALALLTSGYRFRKAKNNDKESPSKGHVDSKTSSD
jgi:hypothetical protein